MTTLPITLNAAGVAVLINIWLGVRVSQLRVRNKVPIGEGGDQRVIARMRAQANFVEYTPFFLILLGLIELSRGSQQWLWWVTIVYFLGRLVHPFGLDRPAPNPLRMAGIVITWLVLLGLAAYALAIPYLDRAREPAVHYAAQSAPL